MQKTVVVVDDDAKVILQLEKALTGMGYLVFKAEEGETALELVKKEKPHLLISDLLLPRIHGAELCSTIKQDPELKDTKIIMMTAVYNEASYKLDIDCRADAFIEKPFDSKKIIAMAAELLN